VSFLELPGQNDPYSEEQLEYFFRFHPFCRPFGELVPGYVLSVQFVAVVVSVV
jgi:hypothetical protein